MGQDDLDSLLNFLLPFARRMLEKYGEVYPSAVAVRKAGGMVPLGGDTGKSEPTVQEVMESLLVRLCRGAREGEYRAVALCLDVRVTNPQSGLKSDAICVSIESETGTALDVFLPYRSVSPAVLEYGEMFALEARRRVFPKTPPSNN